MPGNIGTDRPLKQKINNTAVKEPWPLAKCCKYEAFCWRYKTLWVGAQGNGSYKVVISSKKLFLLSCESCVCVSISACMCFSGLHYPDELLREWASWVLWDIDWGDDPVSLHAFELAVCVSWWKRYFLQILGHDWRDSNFLDLWKGNDLVEELYSDHIWAVKCHYIMQCWSVGPPHTEIHLKKLLGRDCCLSLYRRSWSQA